MDGQSQQEGYEFEGTLVSVRASHPSYLLGYSLRCTGGIEQNNYNTTREKWPVLTNGNR